MRIVAGRWAGRHLTSPAGRVRPTAEEVRDAWMGSLAELLPGARILELFAGSGAVGLEALSRGAASVDFVESGPGALHALRSNVTALGARGSTRIFRMDALAFLPGISPGHYDLVLADPPYGSGILLRIIEDWRARGTAPVLSVEHAAEQELPPGGVVRRFGATAVTTWGSPGGGAPATAPAARPGRVDPGRPPTPGPRGPARRR